MPDHHTVLEEGKMLTLEPGIQAIEGHMMVYKDNIATTQNGTMFLSERAGNALDLCGVV